MPRTKKNKTNLNLEKTLFSKGAKLVAGMDEVGRGSLAGPVYVGITVLNQDLADDDLSPAGLTDSKELTKSEREDLLPKVKNWVLEHSVGQASNSEIDEIGLTRALRRAGRRALNSLVNKPDYLILDGKHNWLMPEKETLDIFNEEVDDGPISANMKIINLKKKRGFGACALSECLYTLGLCTLPPWGLISNASECLPHLAHVVGQPRIKKKPGPDAPGTKTAAI